MTSPRTGPWLGRQPLDVPSRRFWTIHTRQQNTVKHTFPVNLFDYLFMKQHYVHYINQWVWPPFQGFRKPLKIDQKTACLLSVLSVIQNIHNEKEFKKKHGWLVSSSFGSSGFSTANMLIQIHILPPQWEKLKKQKTNKKCPLENSSPGVPEWKPPGIPHKEKEYAWSIIGSLGDLRTSFCGLWKQVTNWPCQVILRHALTFHLPALILYEKHFSINSHLLDFHTQTGHQKINK